MRTKAFLWTLMGCLVAPSIATAQDVYFSMGNEIQKLTLPATSTTLVHTSGMPVGDLALCAGDPDQFRSRAGRQFLYFVERDSEGPDRISRINVNAGAPTRDRRARHARTGTIGEIRLTKDCDVLFATPGGVFQVSGTPELPLATATLVARRHRHQRIGARHCVRRQPQVL